MTPIKLTAFIASLGLLSSCASSPLTLNDNQIVPGERVGEVEIGMPRDQLLAQKRVPRQTIPMRGTSATTYVFDGLTVGAHDEVYWIIVQDGRFRTAEGISTGAEQITTRAVFGVPDCVVSKADSTVYDYGNIYFDVDNGTGRVEQLGVMEKTQNCKG